MKPKMTTIEKMFWMLTAIIVVLMIALGSDRAITYFWFKGMLVVFLALAFVIHGQSPSKMTKETKLTAQELIDQSQ